MTEYDFTGVNQFDPLINDAANYFNLDPTTLKSVMYVESRGNPKAVNPKTGAAGLMQFMPDTATERGVNSMDPRSAIFGGAAYLSHLLDQYKDPNKALAAYNGAKTPSKAAEYQQLVWNAYKHLTSAASPSDSAPPAAANAKPATQPAPAPVTQQTPSPAPAAPDQDGDDDLSGLSPFEQQLIKGAPARTAPVATGPTQPAPKEDLSGLSPYEQQLITTAKPGAPQQQAESEPGMEGRLTALYGGARQAAANALTIGGNIPGLSAMKTYVPTVAPTADEQAAMSQHPLWSGGGEALGGTAIAAPAVALTEAAAPELTALGVAARYAPYLRYALGMGNAGMWQQLATGDPNQSALARAAEGFIPNALLGPIFGEGARLFGAGKTLPANIAARARNLGNLSQYLDNPAKLADWIRTNAPAGTFPEATAAPTSTAGQIWQKVQPWLWPGGFGVEEAIHLATGRLPSKEEIAAAVLAMGHHALSAAGRAYQGSDRFALGLARRFGQQSQLHTIAPWLLGSTVPNALGVNQSQPTQ